MKTVAVLFIVLVIASAVISAPSAAKERNKRQIGRQNFLSLIQGILGAFIQQLASKFNGTISVTKNTPYQSSSVTLILPINSPLVQDAARQVVLNVNNNVSLSRRSASLRYVADARLIVNLTTVIPSIQLVMTVSLNIQTCVASHVTLAQCPPASLMATVEMCTSALYVLKNNALLTISNVCSGTLGNQNATFTVPARGPG